MSSKQTPEYKTVRSNFHEICQSLSRQHDTIAPLANDLASDRVKLIPEATRSAVTSTRGVPPYELASQLLSAAHVAIEYSPEKLYVLADKLKVHGHEHISVKLLKDCESCGGRKAPVQNESEGGTATRNGVDLDDPILQKAPTLVELTNMVVPPLRNKWRDIGIQLGIKPNDLDAIYDRRNRNPNHCFADVFSQWEDSNNLPYTWAVILEVISSEYVNELAVAKSIEQKLIDKYKNSSNSK